MKNCEAFLFEWMPIYLPLTSTVMALIWGLKGLFPCPICLVPNDLQFDLSKEFPLRTQTDSKNMFLEAMTLRHEDQREALLKTASLRPVEVHRCF
jgi:hypothetical protein